MKKNIYKVFWITAIALLSVNAQASTSGQELFMQKCSMCHKTMKPTDMSTLVAPPISGVAMHVKMKYSSKKDAVAFISDYALNPQRSKALCMPQRIKKFGLMPSQKGSVTKYQLEKIANYIYDNYPKKGFRGMLQSKQGMMNAKQQGMMGNKRGMMASKNKKGKKITPFLIKKGLPHLTKVLMKNWNNPELNLTEKQKEKLLVVRKDTLRAVRKYMPVANIMQSKIVFASLNGINPAKLKILVKKLSKVKANATMAHLNCIYHTKNILTQKQYQYLLQLSKKRKSGRKYRKN